MTKKNLVTGDIVVSKKPPSIYDAMRLRKLIQEKKTAKEILEALNISHTQVLKHHLLKLCATDQKYYEIPGLYNRNSRKAFVNAKGEIKLNMKNIDFGDVVFKPETEFDVTISATQVILTVSNQENQRVRGAEETSEEKT